MGYYLFVLLMISSVIDGKSVSLSFTVLCVRKTALFLTVSEEKK